MSSIQPTGSRCEQTEGVYIPPLNLSGGVNRTTYLPHNLSTGNLHPNATSQNIDFLKEKSLYRYYISKNTPSQGRLIPNRSTKSIHKNTEEEPGPAPSEIKTEKKKGLRMSFPARVVTSPLGLEGKVRDRYFKRTNPILLTASRNKTIEGTHPTINNQTDPNPQNSSNCCIKEIVRKKEAEINALSSELRELKLQKERLTERMTQYAERLGQLEVENIQLLQENAQLQAQLVRSRSSISNEMTESTCLQRQIMERQRKINRLESSLKYAEIENDMLKKLKTQCVEQKELIAKLQRSKQLLTSKLKQMYIESRVQKSMKTSFASDVSQISFNLSQEEEDKCRREPETPLRVKGGIYLSVLSPLESQIKTSKSKR